MTNNIERAISTQREQSRLSPRELEFEIENQDIARQALQGIRLSEEERRIRLGSGNVFILTFRTPGKKNLMNDEVKNKDGSEKGKKKVLVRWSKYPTLEDAIKATGHVTDDYDQLSGERVVKFRSTVAKVKQAGEFFARGEVTKENLGDFAMEIATEIVESGLDSAVKPNLQRAADLIVMAMTLDSKGRMNSPRSRLSLAQGNEYLKEELLFTELVDDKFVYLAHRLHVFRGDVRRDLERVRKSLDALSNMRETNVNYQRTVDALSTEISNSFSPLRSIPNPYRMAAHSTRILFNGTQTDLDFQILSDMVGAKSAQSYIETIPVVSLTSQRRRSGMLSQCEAEIRSALHEGDRILSA